MKLSETAHTVIYQAKNGKIEFKGDFEKETIWASQKHMADVFNVNVRTVNEHLKKIYRTGELVEKSTIRKFRIVRKEGKREVERAVNHYNLDVILSVGYRVNSKQATQFRIWATKVLKEHLLKGFTVNKKQIAHNYNKFSRAISDVKALMPRGGQVHTEEIVELIHAFATTWFSLDAYDSEKLPTSGTSKKAVEFTTEELRAALDNLKHELIVKKQATELFGRERTKQGIDSIVGNIFQSFGGKDVYPSLEEKAAHLLYFIVKNHPFTDGNKRSGAFAFIWFLKKSGLLRASLTSEALTAITLLVASSAPKDKGRMIGLVMLLLQKN